MTSIDFNKFKGDNFDLIPANTVAVVQTRIRFCDAGIDGILKPTKAGDAHGLDLEFTVVDGPHAKRKFFGFWLVQGETDGQKMMVERTMGMLRAMVDSAKYLDPSDTSPKAAAERQMELRDFDGLRFLGEIGIEKSRDAQYPDKNVLLRVITKDRPMWGQRPPIEQSPSVGQPRPATAAKVDASTGTAAPAASVSKPAWAD
jgi:hypothetical protein